MKKNTNGYSWFVRRRMEFITDALHIFGFINREHLQRKFGISQPQASNDLTRYATLYPGAMFYDPNAKRYVAKTRKIIR